MHAISTNNLSNIQDIVQNRQVYSVYQAIVDTQTMSVTAYEALSRGPDGLLHNPLALFDHAHCAGITAELEFLCVELACTSFDASLKQRLFLNIHPQILLHPSCKSKLLESIKTNPALCPKNIVLELSERESIEDFDSFRAVLADYRDMGFGIAIDDLGAAYCGLQRWLELKPEFIKIDRHFIQNIHVNKEKADFMRGLVSLAATTQSELIVEGVELRDEAELLHNLGVRLMQGYYFHRPGKTVGSHIDKYRFGELNLVPSEHDLAKNHNIADLIIPCNALDCNTRLDQVIEHFHTHKNLNAIPLIDGNGLALGIITRRQALDVYTREFGRELNSRKPVRHFMDHTPLIIDAATSFEAASHQLTNNSEEDLIQEFIVSNDRRYVGIVKTIDLLRTITEQQIRSARYANPLTLLPGNVPIDETISKLLRQRADFWVAYCDINNFKAFNDAYGYSQGDIAITVLADVIKAHCDSAVDFVGHVGGDDFIIVFQIRVPEDECAAICFDFQSKVLALYDDTAIQNGGISTLDRQGHSTFYATMSLSIGLVHPDAMTVTSAHAVSALASDAKKEAKKLSDGGVYRSRRRH